MVVELEHSVRDGKRQHCVKYFCVIGEGAFLVGPK